MNLRTTITAALLLAAPALASPFVGGEVPSLVGRSLGGTEFKTDSPDGRATLLVVVTSREAARSAGAWFERARDQGLSKAIRHVALVSIHKPFFVPQSLVESRARAAIPQRYWPDVVVDGGDITRTLGVPVATEPLALAVAPDGTVSALVKGAPEGAAARDLFAALKSKPRALAKHRSADTERAPKSDLSARSG